MPHCTIAGACGHIISAEGMQRSLCARKGSHPVFAVGICTTSWTLSPPVRRPPLRLSLPKGHPTSVGWHWCRSSMALWNRSQR